MDLEQRVSAIEERMTNVELDIKLNNGLLSKVDGNVMTLIKYVENNSATGETGLVFKYNELKQEVQDLKNAETIKKKVAIKSAAIWASITSAVLIIGKWVISHLVILK